jgi:hypothetical protein
MSFFFTFFLVLIFIYLLIVGVDDIVTHTRACARTHAHSRYGSPGRVNNPSQRPLHNNKQSQETDIYAPAGFEPAIPASKWPQTHFLDRAPTSISLIISCTNNNRMNSKLTVKMNISIQKRKKKKYSENRYEILLVCFGYFFLMLVWLKVGEIGEPWGKWTFWRQFCNDLVFNSGLPTWRSVL